MDYRSYPSFFSRQQPLFAHHYLPVKYSSAFWVSELDDPPTWCHGFFPYILRDCGEEWAARRTMLSLYKIGSEIRGDREFLSESKFASRPHVSQRWHLVALNSFFFHINKIWLPLSYCPFETRAVKYPLSESQTWESVSGCSTFNLRDSDTSPSHVSTIAKLE